MNEAYVSFEVANLLKEKGFNERSSASYDSKGELQEGYGYWNKTPIWYAAPTHQMAMKWLREIHNIFILIEPHSYNYIEEKNSSYVFSFWLGDNYCENPLLKEYYSYEDAVEAALKYCLENLI